MEDRPTHGSYSPSPSESRPLTIIERCSLQLSSALASGDTKLIVETLDRGLSEGAIDYCEVSYLRKQSRTVSETARQYVAQVSAAFDHLRTAKIAIPASLRDRMMRKVGHTALMLSGGGKLGNYHLGVLRALHGAGLLPATLSGASAGSVMAAVAGTRNDEELRQFLAQPGAGMASAHEERDGNTVPNLTQSELARFIASKVPDLTFAEAYAKSGRRINIVVADAQVRKAGAVLNTQSAPHALIRDAVVASCAVPFVYQPVQIRTRSPDGKQGHYRHGSWWIDGSIYSDLPYEWLRNECGATRLIASVVNPFELPMMFDPHRHGETVHLLGTTGFNIARSYWSTMVGIAAPFMRSAPGGLTMLDLWRQVLDQRVEADVFITPRKRFHNLRRLVEHATLTQLREFIDQGEGATNRRLPYIEPILRLEQMLR